MSADADRWIIANGPTAGKIGINLAEDLRSESQNELFNAMTASFPPNALSHQLYGVGRTVVLIHGLAGSGRWWAKNLDPLTAQHSVYTVDMAGFGDSRRFQRFRLGEALRLLIEWLDNVGIDRTTVVGHSMGGLIAAQLAAELPHRVDRLILVDAAFLSFDPGFGKRAKGLARALRVSSSELVRLVARDTLRSDPISLTRATFELLRYDWRSCLPQIAAPTLIVWGELDTVTPLRIGEGVLAALPSARLVVIPGAGHVPMWDSPDTFNAEILAFLCEEVIDSEI